MSLLQKSLNVIPAKAGIQVFRGFLDPGFRRGDGSIGFCRRLSRPVYFRFKQQDFRSIRFAMVLRFIKDKEPEVFSGSIFPSE
jgi:hypothetical protein